MQAGRNEPAQHFTCQNKAAQMNEGVGKGEEPQKDNGVKVRNVYLGNERTRPLMHLMT